MNKQIFSFRAISESATDYVWGAFLKQGRQPRYFETFPTEEHCDVEVREDIGLEELREMLISEVPDGEQMAATLQACPRSQNTLLQK